MRPTGTFVLLVTLGVAVSACGVETAPEELFAVNVGEPGTAAAAAAPSDLGDGEGEALEIRPVPRRGKVDPDDEPDPPPPPDDPAEPEGGDPTGTDAAVDAVDLADVGTGTDAPDDARRPGPSDQDVARFVAAQTRDAVEHDHHVTDLTGDGVVEVAVGRRAVDGTVEVVLGGWDGAALVERGTATVAARATTLGTLVARDLDGDGRAALLLPHVIRPHRAVLVATVTGGGDLDVPADCPLDDAGRHVFDFGKGAEPVLLACSSRDARGGDALVWDGDRFGGLPAQAAGANRGRGR